MNKFLAHHLGSLKEAYDNGLDESTVENVDETHLVVDMDDGRVLDCQGIKRVAHSGVASGRDRFTICMRISAGEHGKIEKSLVIFQNPNGIYLLLVFLIILKA